MLVPQEREYIIFDIDGTLAHMGDRSPFAWDKVDTDLPNVHVVKMAQVLSQHGKIIVMSGRDSCCRDLTIAWLEKHNVPFFEVHMRAMNDSRKDSIIKKELYEAKVKYRFNILGVFDDRLQVKRLWHELGLPLFGVGDPDADF